MHLMLTSGSSLTPIHTIFLSLTPSCPSTPKSPFTRCSTARIPSSVGWLKPYKKVGASATASEMRRKLVAPRMRGLESGEVESHWSSLRMRLGRRMMPERACE